MSEEILMPDGQDALRETFKASKDAAPEEKLAIRYVRLDDAMGMLWKDNPKLHDMQALVKSFEAHGFRDAPAFDANLQEGGGIHDGNGRIEALAWMHDQRRESPRGILQDSDDDMWCLPVQFGVDSASRGMAQALAVDVNNLTMAGGDFTAFDFSRLWDQEPYLALLSDLGEAGDLPVSIDGDALDALLQSFVLEEPVADPGPQIDKAAELQEKWQVERGQVWEVASKTVKGKCHRIMCGDSTVAGDVARLMGGEKAGAIVTDPPYGKNLNTDFRDMPKTRIHSRKYATVEGDNTEFDPTLYLAATSSVLEQFWWGGDYYYQNLPPGGSWLVWDKRNEASDGLIGSQFEMCWSMTPHRRRMIRHHWAGVNARNPGMARAHPTEKAVAVLMTIIIDYCGNGIIVDWFLGSGTTMVAAERLGRKCFGMELVPAYVSVCLERLTGMGLEPRLVDG